MAAPTRPKVEELEAQIDAILKRKSRIAPRRTFGHALAVTEENARRLFGMSLWELFATLADKFGYEVPDREPPKKP